MPGISGAVKQAIFSVIGDFIGGIADLIEVFLSAAMDYLTNTPHPDNLFSFNPPTKGLWPDIYHGIYTETVILFLPVLFGLALGLAMFFNIFTPKQKQTSIRRAVFAYPLAYSWWWFGGWFLKFTNDLAVIIIGDSAGEFAEAITTQAASTGAAGLLVLLVYIGGAGIILVIIAIYLLRRIAIYAYMVAMPILLMFWIVPIKPVEGWAKSMMGKFVPLVLMTLPTALLIRLGTVVLANANGAGAAAASGGGTSGELLSTVLGFATIAGAALVPKYVFSFSSQVSSAVRTGSRAGRGASRGMRASGAGAAAASGGGAPQASDTRSGGSRSGGTSSASSEEHKHDPKTDFSSSRRMRSQRRRRQQRAERIGSGARKAAGKGKYATKKGVKKAGGSAKRAKESVAQNRRADGSTARGVAGDAKDGISRYRERINERMAVRSEELRKKFSANNNGENKRRQASIDEYDDGNGKQPGFEDHAQTDLEEYEDTTASNEDARTAADGSSPRQFESPSTNQTPDETEQVDETGSFSQSSDNDTETTDTNDD